MQGNSKTLYLKKPLGKNIIQLGIGFLASSSYSLKMSPNDYHFFQALNAYICQQVYHWCSSSWKYHLSVCCSLWSQVSSYNKLVTVYLFLFVINLMNKVVFELSYAIFNVFSFKLSFILLQPDNKTCCSFYREILLYIL